MFNASSPICKFLYNSMPTESSKIVLKICSLLLVNLGESKMNCIYKYSLRKDPDKFANYRKTNIEYFKIYILNVHFLLFS